MLARRECAPWGEGGACVVSERDQFYALLHGALADGDRDLLLLAQLHCYLAGVAGFDFGARALWFESELARLRAHGAFPVLVCRRERYEVRLRGRASEAWPGARPAVAAWLAIARDLSPLDGRYDLSGI